MTLDPHDKHSSLWRALEDHFTARLATLRRQNDGALDMCATARLRGQIAEIKAFLSMGTERPRPD